jgi:hypothetical protein
MRRFRSLRPTLAAFPILFLAATVAVQASQVRPINLEEMTQRADRIFSGRCVNVRVAHDPVLDQVVTYVTFAPHRVEKGEIRGSVTIKLLGDQDMDAPPGSATEGVPTFSKGEEVILFLHGDSPHGLTSPVGFGQGKFTVVQDKEGRALALNQLGNESLFRNLSPSAQRRLGQGAEKFKGRVAIPPDALLDLVHSLRP